MELWHALNRGVDGRDIFLDDLDRIRFVHDLYAFNDANPVRHDFGSKSKSGGLRNPHMPNTRELLVQIHGWCLMKNHYHLLLSELVEGGLSLFLRKLNVGYANAFNEKYERKGTLFQGRTKKILIGTDAHFNYILHYIHLNPLDYLNGAELWRQRSHAGITNARSAINYLDGYRWSSYLDYSGHKNFPSILTTDLFDGSFGGYAGLLREYVKDSEGVPTNLQLE